MAHPHQRWFVCGLLFLALVLNYMDRQTLSLTITAIEKETQLNATQYGRLEKGFGYAFAIGGLLFGVLADRVSVKWLYPFVLLGWSAAGLATGYADRLGQSLVAPFAMCCDVERLTLTDDPAVQQSFLGFFVCRVVLGFFESGQWPCALVTTQRLLSAADRPFGNSLLQSGASIGAILTPIVVRLFAPSIESQNLAEHLGWWRSPFVVIGYLGLLWIGPWWWFVRGINLDCPEVESPERVPNSDTEATHGKSQNVNSAVRFEVAVSRFLALAVVVTVINLTWQFFRVWLPKMLEQYHGYTKAQVLWFVPAYYIATDVGCISAGATVKWLTARGWNVHRARMLTFGICASLSALSMVASHLSASPLLLCLLLVIGFGTLGLFPNYYAFTQDLSAKHQGKLIGMLSFLTWVISAEMQELVGKKVDQTGSYASGIFWVGLAPLVGFVALLLLWNPRWYRRN